MGSGAVIPQEVFEQLFGNEPDHDWTLFEATVDLIASHHRLHRDDVFFTMLDLDSEGELTLVEGALKRPEGFAALGLAVVERLLGNAEGIPPLKLLVH